MNQVKCVNPKCKKSPHVVSIGVIHNKSGDKRRYKCQNCGTTMYAAKDRKEK